MPLKVHGGARPHGAGFCLCALIVPHLAPGLSGNNNNSSNSTLGHTCTPSRVRIGIEMGLLVGASTQDVRIQRVHDVQSLLASMRRRNGVNQVTDMKNINAALRVVAGLLWSMLPCSCCTAVLVPQVLTSLCV